MSDPDYIKGKLKAIYDDGFNIYMMLNKLKKQLKRKDNFPDELIIIFCDHYWKYRPRNRYPYFLKAFKMASDQWNADNQIREHEQFKKEGIAESIKELLKGIG